MFIMYVMYCQVLMTMMYLKNIYDTFNEIAKVLV